VDLPELLAHGVGSLLVLVAVAFVGGCLNGSGGIGFATLVSVALALLVDARTAVLLLSGMTPIVMALPVLRHHAQLPHARRLLPMFLTMPLGVLVGTYLLIVLPVAAIALGLGLVTILSTVAGFWRGELQIPPRWERIGSPLMGVVAGAFNSAVGVSGPPLAIYLLSLKVDRALFAFVVASMFSSMGLIRLLTLLAWGEIAPGMAALSLLLCIPAIAGIYTGFWLQRFIDQRTFHRLVLGVLTVSGIQLVYRGLTGLVG
jgi:uncharacterized membrane protein YfcA